MTFTPDSNTFGPNPLKRDLTEPLWSYTQKRLQNMELWSAQHRTTCAGSCERIRAQDERIALACRHLVLLLKDWEEKRQRLAGDREP